MIMRIVKANKNGIKLAIEYLKEGKVVVYPTDTAYGLGVDATNQKAVERFYAVKRREAHKPVHVMVSDIKMVKRYVRLDRLSEKVFKKFAPGPLTIVGLLKTLKKPWIKLSAGTKTMGVRIPKNRIAMKLVSMLGRPITTTSANVAGGKTAYSVKSLMRQYRNEKFKPDLYLDIGRLPRRRTSTIASVAGGKIKIFREGPITKKQIISSLRGA